MWSNVFLIRCAALVTLLVITLYLWQQPLVNIVQAARWARPFSQSLIQLQNVQQIDTGGSHTCAVVGITVGNGGAKCWGDNEFGQLGNGTNTDRWTPVDVSGLTSGVKLVATGNKHSCAVTNSGGIKCWGSNEFGQLGNGSFVNQTTPISVSGINSGVLAVAVGDEHTCTVLTNGNVKCWGRNRFGQLGNGLFSDSVTTPVDVTSVNGAVKGIMAGGEHTCALLNDQTIRCWGRNNLGQLGIGSTTNQQTPTQVTGVSGLIKLLATGNRHTCAVNQNGGVECWGYNHIGQLGLGTTNPLSSTVPLHVPALTTGINFVDAGAGYTCAITNRATLTCWGDNTSGQLGIGSLENQFAPVTVPGLTGLNAVAAGDGSHACALLTGGVAKCWGANSAGQLGDNTTTDRTTPVDVLINEPTSTPTNTPFATATPTPLHTPTATFTLSATVTPTPSRTPTPTFTPSAIATHTPSHTPTATFTPTTAGTPTPTPTDNSGAGNIANLYLPAIAREEPPPTEPPTVTPIVTPLPTWLRIGQPNLVGAALAITDNGNLFVGTRNENNRVGGLYQRTLSGCALATPFTQALPLTDSVLGIVFQGQTGIFAADNDQGIYRTTNNGVNWEKPFNNLSRPRTVAIAGGNAFYVGTEENGVFSSKNGGTDWQSLTSKPQFINVVRLINNSLWIGVDNDQEYGGIAVMGVGETAPRPFNTGLPTTKSKQVWDFAFTINANNSSQIYLATYDGIYRGDGLAAWEPFGLQGIELLSVEIHNGALYAGGRYNPAENASVGGVWWRPLDASRDWEKISLPDWDQKSVRDLLYDPTYCNGLLAATTDGVWLYR